MEEGEKRSEEIMVLNKLFSTNLQNTGIVIITHDNIHFNRRILSRNRRSRGRGSIAGLCKGVGRKRERRGRGWGVVGLGRGVGGGREAWECFRVCY